MPEVDNQSYPYSAVVYVESTFPNGRVYFGSGVIVGKNDVLTAAHNVYSIADGGYATSVRIVPGYDPNPPESPFGSYYASTIDAYTNFDLDGDGLLLAGDGLVGYGSLGTGSEVDLAILGFNTPIGRDIGMMWLDVFTQASPLNITGYPDRDGDGYPDNPLGQTATASLHPIDWYFRIGSFSVSPGNSGGPLWWWDGATGHVAGVVSTRTAAASIVGHAIDIWNWLRGNDYLVGDDGLYIAGGAAADSFSGSEGGDQISGGGGSDTIAGFGGADIISGGTGSDILRGGNGDDLIFGGNGTDTFVYEQGTVTFSGSTILSISGGHDRFIGGNGKDTASFGGSIATTTARAGISVFAAGDDALEVWFSTGVAPINIASLSGVESLLGTVVDDFISGTSAAEVLNGNDGNDAIRGGGGRDVLTGGKDADTFLYSSASESGRGAAVRDRITDFTRGSDVIDLSAIDAGGPGGAFAWRGRAAFGGTPGELRYAWQDLAGTAGDLTIIVGDLNGDRIGDLQIELPGLRTLAASDFAL